MIRYYRLDLGVLVLMIFPEADLSVLKSVAGAENLSGRSSCFGWSPVLLFCALGDRSMGTLQFLCL